MLARIGVQKIDVALGGQEALDAILQKHDSHYSAILMDIQMPDLSGYDTTRAIRLMPGGHLPFIIGNSAYCIQIQDDCQKAGMNNFLFKPIRLKQLKCALLSAQAFGVCLAGTPISVEAPPVNDAKLQCLGAE